jgi:ligand-binding sensor domain-containing protein
MYEDSRGLIWLLTGGDVFTFDKDSEEFHRYLIDSLSYQKDILPVKRPGRILENFSGNIWITTRSGLYKYSADSGNLTAFSQISGKDNSLSHNNVTNIVQDPSGILWCSTLGRGLYRITDPDNGVFEKIDIGISNEYSGRFDSLSVLLADKHGNIWAFGKVAVICYDPGKKKSKNYIIEYPLGYSIKKAVFKYMNDLSVLFSNLTT